MDYIGNVCFRVSITKQDGRKLDRQSVGTLPFTVVRRVLEDCESLSDVIGSMVRCRKKGKKNAPLQVPWIEQSRKAC